MSTPEERCPYCDRRPATDRDFGSTSCESAAVDWRARALAAEALLSRAVAVLPPDAALAVDIRAAVKS